jgi:hypothetical protein
MTIAPHDFDAMQRAIDVMRHESPDRAKQIEHKLKHEGFKAAGHFAAYAVQCASLRLKPWEAPPSCPWGNYCSGGIELRDRLLVAWLSVYEPDPTKALAEAEAKPPLRACPCLPNRELRESGRALSDMRRTQNESPSDLCGLSIVNV